jgi:hypothetical protein
MANDAPLNALLEGGIHQSTKISVAPHDKPFILFRQTSDTPDVRGDDRDNGRQTGFMIFAHDVPGDYLRIDAILARLKILFGDTNDPANLITRSIWLESSDDTRDEDMGTITRWGRILVKYKEPT